MLLLLFILVPLVEFVLILKVGALMGGLATIGIIVATGILGAGLARQQGLAVLAGLQAELAAGRSPTRQIVEGVLVLVAGVVLLAPGFLTDIAGFLLLLPPVRALVAARLQRSLQASAGQGRVRMHVFGGGGRAGGFDPFGAQGRGDGEGPGAAGRPPFGGPRRAPGVGPASGPPPDVVDAEVVDVKGPDEPDESDPDD